MALKLLSTVMYLSVIGMLSIMNKIQPSQLAEEQRNATRLFKQLHNQIQTIIEIGNPTTSDVKEMMKKLLALDKAYSLSLLGGNDGFLLQTNLLRASPTSLRDLEYETWAAAKAKRWTAAALMSSIRSWHWTTSGKLSTLDPLQPISHSWIWWWYFLQLHCEWKGEKIKKGKFKNR
ncbi:putative F-box protein [Forsythia ovata]|uniref:F-box protein n=1 Tax=Forsythia ovata TaxID=205694 RepID=A0ABD1SNB2_9LAMI